MALRGDADLFLTTVSNEFAGGVQELALRFRHWRYGSGIDVKVQELALRFRNWR